MLRRRWLYLTLAVLVTHWIILSELDHSLIRLEPAANPTLRVSLRTPQAKPTDRSNPQSIPLKHPPTPPAKPNALPIQTPPDPTPASVNEAIRPVLDHVITAPNSSIEPAVLTTATRRSFTETDSSPNIAVVAAAIKKPLVTPPETSTTHKSWQIDAKHFSRSTRLVYSVKSSKFPFTLSGELLWRRDGDRYQTRLRYSALGLARTQTSRGRITAQGLAPDRFADKYRNEVAAHFNYPQAKVTFSANTPEAPLLAGAQDRLSVLIQLGARLASNPEQASSGSTLTIQTVGPRAADMWLFTVGSTEPLALPGGNIEGIKLERLPRELYDQTVEVWLSPQLGYLPARIRITESNGDSIDQRWEATEAVEAEAAPAQPSEPVH
ncbi:MAG: DUF3108 domain-containing protein [Rhodoferax sp.]|nr:DUF3108 domain-containing protein [Rhodoferax sp.]